jgi:hypothetical protein
MSPIKESVLKMAIRYLALLLVLTVGIVWTEKHIKSAHAQGASSREQSRTPSLSQSNKPSPSIKFSATRRGLDARSRSPRGANTAAGDAVSSKRGNLSQAADSPAGGR